MSCVFPKYRPIAIRIFCKYVGQIQFSKLPETDGFTGVSTIRRRHVARLRRLGSANFFWGGIDTGKHSQLTVAISGCDTVLRVGKTTLRAEQADFLFVPHL